VNSLSDFKFPVSEFCPVVHRNTMYPSLPGIVPVYTNCLMEWPHECPGLDKTCGHPQDVSICGMCHEYSCLSLSLLWNCFH
jgi:hypothetical protein